MKRMQRREKQPQIQEQPNTTSTHQHTNNAKQNRKTPKQKAVTDKFISLSKWLAFHLYWVPLDRKMLSLTSGNTRHPFSVSDEEKHKDRVKKVR